MWQRSEKIYLSKVELELPEKSYLLKDIKKFTFSSPLPKPRAAVGHVLLNVGALVVLPLMALPLFYYGTSYINFTLASVAKSYNRPFTPIDAGEIWDTAQASTSALERYLTLFSTPAMQAGAVVAYIYLASYIFTPALLGSRLTIVMKSGEKIYTEYQPAPHPIIFFFARFSIFIRKVNKASKRALKEHLIDGGDDEFGFSSPLYSALLRYSKAPYLLALFAFSLTIPVSMVSDNPDHMDLLARVAIFLLIFGFVANRRIKKSAEALDMSSPMLISTRIYRLANTLGLLLLTVLVGFATDVNKSAWVVEAMMALAILYWIAKPINRKIVAGRA